MKVNRCSSGKRGSEQDLHLIVFVEFYYATILRRLLRGYKADLLFCFVVLLLKILRRTLCLGYL